MGRIERIRRAVGRVLVAAAIGALAGMAVAVLTPAVRAQSSYPTAAPGVRVGGVVPLTCDANGANCKPVPQGPSSGAAAGIVPTVTPNDTSSSLVVCSAACNLYGFTAKATAAGYFIVTNTTAVPADGAITGLLTCIAYPTADVTVSLDASIAPIRAGTGVTISFSTTGCYTKTTSATATISALAKQ